MPYIDAKLTCAVSNVQKEALKAELGKAISLMDKSESFLMIGFQDNYDLYFGGNRLEKGAYVSVAMLGEPDRRKNEAMTARVTEILEEQLGIPAQYVYVSYHGVRDWGWRGNLL